MAPRRREPVYLWPFAVLLLAYTATAADPERVASRQLRQQQETTATDSSIVATVVPAGSATSTDDDTHTWEFVETQSTASSHSGSTHQAQLDLQEKTDSGKSSATNTPSPSSSATSTSSGSSSTATTHHSTPMTGYVVVGALAIVCVGVAAGVAKRKKEAAGSTH